MLEQEEGGGDQRRENYKDSYRPSLEDSALQTPRATVTGLVRR